MAADDAIDFTELGQDAKSIIEANGRACSFTRAGSAPADPDKEWRGNSNPGTGGTAAVTYSGIIALLYDETWDEEQHPMEQARRPYEWVLVAEDSFPSGHIDLRTIERVSDGLQTYRVVKSMPVQPGAKCVIWQMKLET